MGIAKASTAPVCSHRRPPLAAVSIPITWFELLRSGPPESPGWMAAFIWIIPERLSRSPPV